MIYYPVIKPPLSSMKNKRKGESKP